MQLTHQIRPVDVKSSKDEFDQPEHELNNLLHHIFLIAIFRLVRISLQGKFNFRLHLCTKRCDKFDIYI